MHILLSFANTHFHLRFDKHNARHFPVNFCLTENIYLRLKLIRQNKYKQTINTIIDANALYINAMIYTETDIAKVEVSSGFYRIFSAIFTYFLSNFL